MNRLKKAFNKNRWLWYGCIGTVALIALVFGIVAVSEANFGKRTYTADFIQAGGVRPGDEVRVAGIKVGEVTDTELAGDRVKMTMAVDNKVDLRDNATATIKMSTLLGMRFIDLWPGNSDAGFEGTHFRMDKEVPDRSGTLMVMQTQVPYDLQKTIEAGTPILSEIDDAKLAESINAVTSQLDGLPAITRPTLDALTEMSDVVNNRQDQITQLIKDTRTITDTVLAREADLSTIVGQGAELATKITARQELVTRLLDGIAELMTAAEQIAADNQNQLAPFLSNLQTITAGLEENRDNLRKLLEILPVTARLTTNIVGDGPYANSYLPWGLFPDNWLCLARVVDGC